MDYPNHGYFAIGFIQPKETNAKWFLSSDGEGIMNLKQPNTDHFGPPQNNHFIDPALLFRLVEPWEESAYRQNQVITNTLSFLM